MFRARYGIGMHEGPTPLAEGTALALRAHLLTTARPELLVAADVQRAGGPDLVCWQWQPGQVWAWQLRYEYDGRVPMRWPPPAVLATVAAASRCNRAVAAARAAARLA